MTPPAKFLAFRPKAAQGVETVAYRRSWDDAKARTSRRRGQLAERGWDTNAPPKYSDTLQKTQTMLNFVACLRRLHPRRTGTVSSSWRPRRLGPSPRSKRPRSATRPSCSSTTRWSVGCGGCGAGSTGSSTSRSPSTRTSLALHGLTGAQPAQHHLTLPASWAKRRLVVPEGVVLHFGDVAAYERCSVGPVPVTTPSRTRADCAALRLSLGAEP